MSAMTARQSISRAARRSRTMAAPISWRPARRWAGTRSSVCASSSELARGPRPQVAGHPSDRLGWFSEHEFEGGLSNRIEAGTHNSSGFRPETNRAGAEPVGRTPSAAPNSQKQNGAAVFAGRFSGRTAIVTGGASGLGQLTAARILQEGGKVSLWDVNAEAVKSVAQKLGNVHAVAVNVGRYP